MVAPRFLLNYSFLPIAVIGGDARERSALGCGHGRCLHLMRGHSMQHCRNSAVEAFQRGLLSDPLPTVSHFGRLRAQVAESKDHLVVGSLCDEMGARCVVFAFSVSIVLFNYYFNLGCVPYALLVFGKMLQTGCSPNVVTFSILLRGCGGWEGSHG